jgi:DNA replication protein DnaC
MLPTVLTSNFSMKELAERLDIRIVDRLQEMVRVVPLTGKSRRGAQQ